MIANIQNSTFFNFPLKLVTKQAMNMLAHKSMKEPKKPHKVKNFKT